MAAAVARAAQQTQEAVQAQVESQIRWISDDLPKMLKLQAEKALHQLGEFQPMDAAAAADGPPPSGMPVGAADAASALAPGTGPETELEAPASPPNGASPGKSLPPASAAQPPLVEQPFWALAEPEPVSVTAASAPDDAADQARESASTPLERARSDLLAAAQRVEQAQRAKAGAGWEQAQAELLQAAAAVVANAGALTGTAPPFGNPGLAAAPGGVWPWNGPHGHELPPQWSMSGAMPGAMPGATPGPSAHAPPPWAAPWASAAWGETSPWGCHPSSWPDAAHSHASQMQWAAASAAQPLRPQTASAARPVTGPPPLESSCASGRHAMVDDGKGTPDAGSAGDVDGRAAAGKASGFRMASMLDASPRLFSPCAYSPSTFDAPAQLLTVGPGPDFDSAPSPMQAAEASRANPSADDVSSDAPAAENVAASRPNFATRSKGGGFFNKNSAGAVQVSSPPGPAPQQGLRRLTPLRACACFPQPFRRSAVPSKSTSTPDCKCGTVDQPSVLAPLSSPSSSVPLPQSAAQPRDAPADFEGPLHAERVSANMTRAPGAAPSASRPYASANTYGRDRSYLFAEEDLPSAQSAHGDPFMPPAEAPPLASHAGHVSAPVPAASFDVLEELPLNSTDVEERASLESADGVSVPSRSRRSSRSLSRRNSADDASLPAESPSLSLNRDSATTRDEPPAAEGPTERQVDIPTCSEGEGPSEGPSESERHDSGAVTESTGAGALAPRRDLGSQLPEESLAPAAAPAPVERPSMSQASAMAKFKSAAAAVGCVQAGARQSTAGGAALAPAAVPLSTLSLGAKKSSAVHRPAIAQKIMRLGASGSDSDGSSTEVPGAGGALAPRLAGDDDSDFD